MKRITLPIAIIGMIAVSACTSPTKATKTLKNQGYTDIVAGGYSMFGCSDDDFYKTKFKATSPSGSRVTGVVCSGLFKGSTVRFD